MTLGASIAAVDGVNDYFLIGSALVYDLVGVSFVRGCVAFVSCCSTPSLSAAPSLLVDSLLVTGCCCELPVPGCVITCETNADGDGGASTTRFWNTRSSSSPIRNISVRCPTCIKRKRPSVTGCSLCVFLRSVLYGSRRSLPP